MRFATVWWVILAAVLVQAQEPVPGPVKPITAGTAVPILLHGAAPKYPKDALKLRIEGTVRFNAVIGKDGHVKDLKLVDGNALLTGAAQQAVQKWVYKPATYDGALIEAPTEIAVEFKLPGHEKDAAVNTSPSSVAQQQIQPISSEVSSESQDKTIYKVGHGVSAPRPTYAPSPEYTEQSRQSKAEGTVVLWMVVTEQGTPKDIKLVRTNVGDDLVQQAIQKVSTWKFEPATKDGKPVAVEIHVEVSFKTYHRRS